jgi:hypothetical protein
LLVIILTSAFGLLSTVLVLSLKLKNIWCSQYFGV